MDINVSHSYSHIGEQLLIITYNYLGVKLTGTLQVSDGCSRTKSKSRAVRKNTYTRSSQPGKRILLDMTGPFLEILIVNSYCIGVVDNYRRYFWSFFTKTKSQVPKKMEGFFENMTSHGTPSKYLRCDKTGEHQSKLHKECVKEILRWNI